MKADTAHIREALDFLDSSGLSDLDLSVVAELYSKSINIQTAGYRVTGEDVRLLKKIFGPLEMKQIFGTDDKYLVGEHIVSIAGSEDPIRLCLRIYNSHTCTPLNPDNLDDAKLEEIASRIVSGDLKIPECEPNYKPEPQAETD